MTLTGSVSEVAPVPAMETWVQPSRPMAYTEHQARNSRLLGSTETNWFRSHQIDRTCSTVIQPSVDIAPRDIARRRMIKCGAMAAEIVQLTRCERVELHFHAPVHLLIAVERGVRVAGETSIDGVQGPTIRDLGRRLTFVPAGHTFREWQRPAELTRTIYFYFDPDKLMASSDLDGSELREPRLLFQDGALWETAIKLEKLIQSPSSNGIRLEALAVILAYELARPENTSQQKPAARGGLSAWNKRILLEYIEEHIAQRISLADLAKLVRLSPYHLCRAFKESVGLPPHQYLSARRIERAKALLAKPTCSVTEIGFALGFCETSSFSAAFRKATGSTPSAYHRSFC